MSYTRPGGHELSILSDSNNFSQRGLYFSDPAKNFPEMFRSSEQLYSTKVQYRYYPFQKLDSKPVISEIIDIEDGNPDNSLLNLDVVQTIIKNSPDYSPDVWSTTTDGYNYEQIPQSIKSGVDLSDSSANCEKTEDSSLPIEKLEENCFSISGLSEIRIDEVETEKIKENDDDKSQDISDSEKKVVAVVKNDEKRSFRQNSSFVNNRRGRHYREQACSSFTFKLSDFLKSLQSREGRYHKISWNPDHKRRKSLPECPVSDLKNDKPASANDAKSVSLNESGIKKDSRKYKTELCRSFQYNGYCEYGDSCLYAHGSVDLRSYPKHPMYRTKKCFSFHLKGFCLYGSRCQFLHDSEDAF